MRDGVVSSRHGPRETLFPQRGSGWLHYSFMGAELAPKPRSKDASGVGEPRRGSRSMGKEGHYVIAACEPRKLESPRRLHVRGMPRGGPECPATVHVGVCLLHIGNSVEWKSR